MGEIRTFSRAAVVITDDVVGVLMPLTTRRGELPFSVLLPCEGLRALTTSLTARA